MPAGSNALVYKKAESKLRFQSVEVLQLFLIVAACFIVVRRHHKQVSDILAVVKDELFAHLRALDKPEAFRCVLRCGIGIGPLVDRGLESHQVLFERNGTNQQAARAKHSAELLVAVGCENV